ncbi:hypothetical protein TSAR_003153 [Trichomalopsis sarcophagae]|uniref:THAP-type domain-containing protein n=1 Tax=Trichomalopsis sarcophagae TaxID=543379 RepID=A0A232F198_9HYME|nr:hypothetical protein TSAR_003153 [Trichomalopsis sarcophagae]
MGKGRRCIVPSCRYLSGKNDLEKRAMFKIPKDEEKARIWAAAIPGITHPLTTYQTVCEKHFESWFIHRFYEKGTNIMRSRLHNKAVPTIFDTENVPNQNVILLRQHSEKQSRKAPKKGISSSNISEKSTLEVSSAFSNNSLSNQTASNETSLQEIVKDLSLSEKLLMDIKQEMFPFSEDGVKHEDIDERVKTESDVDTKEITAYEHLHKNFSFYITQLPENWNLTRLALSTDQVFVFSKECTVCENGALIVMNEKSIVINKHGDIHYSIHGKIVSVDSSYTPSVINDIDTLLDVVLKFDEVKVCQGICTNEFEVDKDFVLQKDDLGYSRHIHCSLIADKQQCDACWEYSQYLLALMVNNTPVLGNETARFYNQIYS